MRIFNAFQLTVMFAAFPFIIAWLINAEFAGAKALYYAAVAAYIIQFGFNVAAYVHLLEAAQ